ncbi:hypothetical protein BGX34_004791 [Mortierella sp. NVP85]|nr:hypothetical protein BGX34_004791 [Mortierella sp. NVP85]
MSVLNTLLQYLVIVSVVYLYSKTSRSKKSSAANMRGALGRLHSSGLANYYASRKRSWSTKGCERIEESKERSRVAGNSDSGSKERPLQQQQQQQQQQQLPDPPVKNQPKHPRMSSAAAPLKQKAAKPDMGTKRPQHQQQKQQPAAINYQTTSDFSESPVSEDMAVEHRRFLGEMFKDVPAIEIDRVIQSVHWDVEEAATVLAQEDYTWQAVRRRRNGPGVETA